MPDRDSWGDYIVTNRGRWKRTVSTVLGEKPRVRHYVKALGVEVRVPWLAWAMFS